MTWYSETLTAHGQKALLVGTYNPPAELKPTIEITLQIEDQPIKILFTNKSRGLAHEEPTPEQILEKFGHKIDKFRNAFLNSQPPIKPI